MAVPQPNLGLFRRYLFASICGGLAVLVTGIYTFRFSELPELKEVLTRKQAEADSIQLNLRNSMELPDHLATLQKGMIRLEEKVMRLGDVAAYQQFFFKLETDSGVKIVRLQPASVQRAGQAKSVGAYRPMGFEVTVEGNFGQISHFLRNIESGPRHYRLVSFAVRRGGATGSPQADIINLVMGLELLGSQ